MDLAILRTLNNLAGGNVYIGYFSVFLAEYLPYLAAAAFLFILLLWRRPIMEKFRVFYCLIIVSLVSYLAVLLGFNNLWPRLRPYDSLLYVSQLIPEWGLSFPSKHAVLSFLLAVFAYYINKKAGFWFLVAAFLVSLGRVATGVHYSSDVVVGAIVGVLMGWAGISLVKKISS